MDRQDLMLLGAYNEWANRRTLDAAERLSAEQFTRDMRSSHSSVRDTLVHVMNAEQVWLQRLRGEPVERLAAADFPDVAAVRRRCAELDADVRAHVAALEDPGRPATFVAGDGSRQTLLAWQVLAHAFNHATYHRGQVVTLLRQLGAQPNATDLMRFLVEGAAPGG
jgi:uncharacterized damage-inducible protein DinB